MMTSAAGPGVRLRLRPRSGVDMQGVGAEEVCVEIVQGQGGSSAMWSSSMASLRASIMVTLASSMAKGMMSRPWNCGR